MPKTGEMGYDRRSRTPSDHSVTHGSVGREREAKKSYDEDRIERMVKRTDKFRNSGQVTDQLKTWSNDEMAEMAGKDHNKKYRPGWRP